jgi:hypothetical protein
MTGLLADPLTDPAGLGAVRADLASVVPQVLEPARVSLRISHCDRDWLTRDRRWRERSQADGGFDRQPTYGPVVTLACGPGQFPGHHAPLGQWSGRFHWGSGPNSVKASDPVAG